MFINGEWQTDAPTFPVFNPATGEEIGLVADAGADDARRAIDAAHAALPAWMNETAYSRSALLYRAHLLMLEQQRELAELMTREQGKPLKASMNEVKYAADFLLWFAEEAKRVYGETIPSARSDQRFLVQKQAVGVVAAVTPWNYPISMLTRKLGPALAAGLHRCAKACGKHASLRCSGLQNPRTGRLTCRRRESRLCARSKTYRRGVLYPPCRSQADIYGLHRSRQAFGAGLRASTQTGINGAWRSRAIYRVRRRRPGPCSEGSLTRQVLEHRPSLHQPQSDFCSTTHSRSFPRNPAGAR